MSPMPAERRKNFRCPPGSDGATVVLRLNGIDHNARVVNVSAQGFRISFEIEGGAEPAKIGDVAMLATGNGSHQVRVANVHLQDGALENRLVELGLERLADFVRQKARVRKIDLTKECAGGGRRGDASSSMLVKVVVVAAVAVLGIIGINLTLTAWGNSSGHTFAGSVKEGAPQHGPAASPAASPAKFLSQTPEREPARFDASPKIAAALKRANRENKTVVVEFGTERCESCYRLRDFIAKNAGFAAAFQRDFILVLVDKVANISLFNRLVPAAYRNENSFFTLLDKEGRPVKGETTDNIADGSGYDINKIKALLQSSPSGN
jgi:Thioredoxin-like